MVSVGSWRKNVACHTQDYALCFVFYLIMTAIRGVMIVLFYPLLARLGCAIAAPARGVGIGIGFGRAAARSPCSSSAASPRNVVAWKTRGG